MSLIRKLAASTCRERRLLLMAAFFMFLAKGLLLVVPFRRVVGIIKPTVEERPDEDVVRAVREIRTALRRAGRLSFWRNRCLVLSIAGRWMLNRRGVSNTIYLGVRMTPGGKPEAHAWLKAGDFEVVEGGDDFRELYSF